MTNVVLPESESHWYSADGIPVYEVPRADGKGMRKTTVADARKYKLLPSVTTILGVLYKPGLASWINTQYVLAALTLPRVEAESLDEFAARVVRDAGREGQSAADAGTHIHKVVEWYLTARDNSDAIIDMPTMSITDRLILDGFREWVKKHTIKVDHLEYSFGNPELGFGGRVDFLGEVDGVRVVADWKSQQTEPDKEVRIYPEWGPQLSAYAHGLGEPDLPGLSVVISRNEPGRVQSHLWLDDWCWPVFQACQQIYYSPLGGGSSLGFQAPSPS